MAATGRATRRLALAAGLALGAFALEAAAEKDGIDSTLYFNGAVGCGSAALGETEGCHADPESDLVMVLLEGPDEIAIEEMVGFYTASVSCQSPLQCAPVQGAQQGSGINVLIDPVASTSDCVLDPFPQPESQQLVPIGSVLSHQDAENPGPTGSLGVYSYSFLLKDCTVPGTIRLLVAMNTFNGDGESTFDAWNQAEMTITVPEPAGAAAAAVAPLLGLAAARRRRR